jgi:hypothetical protein
MDRPLREGDFALGTPGISTTTPLFTSKGFPLPIAKRHRFFKKFMFAPAAQLTFAPVKL